MKQNVLIIKERREYDKHYYNSHKKEIKKKQKKYQKQYYNANKERIKKHNTNRKEERKQYQKQYYNDKNIKLKEYQKQYRLNNKEKIKQYCMNNKELRKQQRRKINLKQYGITPKQYNEIFNKQEGKCAICDKHQNEFKRALFVDHNHITNKIRGLLCSKCNFILGNANDSIELLEKTIKYLKNN